MTLTTKQMLFANEYLIHLNATRAYRTAYPNCKKDETAAPAGSRLLKNVKVAGYIEERMRDREQRTEITQDKVLKELAEIGFISLNNGNDDIKFKPSDKLKALELIGRHLGMFREKADFPGETESVNPYACLTTEELRKMINDG